MKGGDVNVTFNGMLLTLSLPSRKGERREEGWGKRMKEKEKGRDITKFYFILFYMINN